jgi:hypothetical protein
MPTVLAVNAALGGLTAGIWRASTGHSFWRGFVRGASAGGAVFVGKRIIAARKPWTWWTGREIAAIGSAEVLNAAEGRPVLDRVALPLGPVRLHVTTRSGFHVNPRLDLSTTVAAIYVASRSDTQFGWRETLSTGSLVFLTPEVAGGVGSHAAGVVTINEFVPDGNFFLLENKRGVLSHEMVHAAQYDFLSIAWGDPVEDMLAEKIPGGVTARRYIDFGILVPVHAALNNLMRPKNRPWEKEATAFASGH